MQRATRKEEIDKLPKEEIERFLKIALDIILDKKDGILVIMEKSVINNGQGITMEGLSMAKGLNKHVILHSLLDSAGIDIRDALLHEMAANN